MKIYTKKGDTGRTMLFGGKKISKISTRIETLGKIDETNSLLGIIVAHCDDKKLKSKLIREQSNLLRLGADIATPYDVKPELQKHVKRINAKDVEKLEKEIDEWDKSLTKLTKFILPGGTKASAFTHHARSVCRRAEIKAVKLSNEEETNLEVIKYLNRLSDWLFTMARYMNKLGGVKDVFEITKSIY